MKLAARVRRIPQKISHASLELGFGGSSWGSSCSHEQGRKKGGEGLETSPSRPGHRQTWHSKTPGCDCVWSAEKALSDQRDTQARLWPEGLLEQSREFPKRRKAVKVTVRCLPTGHQGRSGGALQPTSVWRASAVQSWSTAVKLRCWRGEHVTC